MKTRINKYAALNALADIREYLRERSDDGELPDEIISKFNLIATKLGSEAGDSWARRKP